MIDHGSLAAEYFLKGYNCCQSVLCAFGDVTGLPEDMALRLASGFGGGMGRLRRTCGALNASVMVLSLLKGSTSTDPDVRGEDYARVRDLVARFEALYGSSECAVLIGRMVEASARPQDRDETYLKTRPCLKIVRAAAELLDAVLEER